jgi:hypothetical protein
MTMVLATCEVIPQDMLPQVMRWSGSCRQSLMSGAGNCWSGLALVTAS